MIRTKEIREALNQLNKAYEIERQRRASIAWKHGVIWAIYRVEEGADLDDLIRLAKEKGVEF
jgi:hypothetical protein